MILKVNSLALISSNQYNHRTRETYVQFNYLPGNQDSKNLQLNTDSQRCVTDSRPERRKILAGSSIHLFRSLRNFLPLKQ